MRPPPTRDLLEHLGTLLALIRVHPPGRYNLGDREECGTQRRLLVWRTPPRYVMMLYEELECPLAHHHTDPGLLPPGTRLLHPKYMLRMQHSLHQEPSARWSASSFTFLVSDLA